MNFIAANCEIFENETGSRGVDFVVKNEKGQYVDVFVLAACIENKSYAYIPKYLWNKELRKNLYVAFVLFTNGVEPIFYLIPSIVWQTPNDLFTDSQHYTSNKPTWGINLTEKTIPILSEKYWFDDIMLNRKADSDT